MSHSESKKLNVDCLYGSNKEVIEHVFSMIPVLLKSGTDRLRIPYLGEFYLKSNGIRYRLGTLIQRMRVNSTQELIDEFRFLWKLRLLVYKREKEKDFISRYGKWHSVKDRL